MKTRTDLKYWGFNLFTCWINSKWIVFSSHLLWTKIVENVPNKVQHQFDLKRKVSNFKDIAWFRSQPVQRGRRKKCPAREKDFLQEPKRNCHPVKGKILDEKTNHTNTNRDIVVFLVCDSFLHEAVVEHIDFKQVILKSILRHIIKGSRCVLQK